jgi:hypothetical protein
VIHPPVLVMYKLPFQGVSASDPLELLEDAAGDVARFLG